MSAGWRAILFSSTGNVNCGYKVFPVMFGTLRLILAFLVVASHVEISHQLDLGGVAVTIFFLLSGYVMTATVRRYYGRPALYGRFILDRAMRIFPQYLFWTAACILWVVCVDRTWRPFGWQEVAENIVLLPAMYGVFDLKPWLTGVRYVTQAWSLSLEWHFYMALPWLLLIPKARTLAGWFSFGVFTLAALNVISPYFYAYHLLPGVLFIFLLGSVAFDEIDGQGPVGVRLLGPWVALLVLGVAGNIRQTLHEAYTAEVFLGILVGLPLVLWLARRPARPWDDWLGNLSYGVFLCHNLVLAGIERTALFRGRWSLCLAATVVSMLLAWLSYLAVERPLIAWRHTLRRRTGLATVIPPSESG